MREKMTFLFIGLLFLTSIAQATESTTIKYNIGKLEEKEGDKEIRLDRHAMDIHISFVVVLRGSAFVVIDLPRGYSLATTLPFKKMGKEKELYRFRYCYLNRDKKASLPLSIHIIREEVLEDTTYRINVGAYPLAEGICE